MKSDIQIAQSIKLLNINEIAKKINLSEDDYECHGRYKAKLEHSILNKFKDKPDGKLILVTAITPTPAGEGKSTVTVGLTQGLNKLGKNSIAALREPSLGPVFGIKGGAAGGGYSQVLPMEELNLHFTGDFHAIGVAHNLISACIDNHIKFGNALSIDVNQITWKRVVDMNDRALRDIVIGLGGKENGTPRQDSFQITVASEIMATLCLSTSLMNLKEKIGNIIFGYTAEGKPLYVRDLKIQGAVTALLKEAIKPNLVQTTENTPVIIHGGPFANIAHGCNSLLATKMALKLSDYVVTEAGFAADLGAEKFLDIKCRKGNLKPSCVVIVATVRALKHHGGADSKTLSQEDLNALKRGIENLDKHIENMQSFGLPVVVAMNKFLTDTDSELDFIRKHCNSKNVEVALCEVWEKGGDGGLELGKAVLNAIETKTNTFNYLYEDSLPLKNKIETICTKIYGASGVNFSTKSLRSIEKLEALGYKELPICMAKTQKSLSDNASLLGRPTNFIVSIDEVKIASGAGFVIAMAGGILDMPGLPRIPSAELIDIDEHGTISGLF